MIKRFSGRCYRNVKHHPDNVLWWTLIAFVAIFIITMLTPKGGIFDWLLGTYGLKQNTLKFIGFGMGGVIAILGALAVNRRANAQAEIAAAQAKTAAAQAEIAKEQAKNNKLIEDGHIQERFKSAIEHLGNESAGMNIAAYYEFYQLAQDNSKLRKNIFEILCAHLRHATGTEEYRKGSGKDKPTEQIQGLLDVLFSHVQLKEHPFMDIQLRKLNGHEDLTNLREVYLQKANLQYKFVVVDLQKANLSGANLQGANFNPAYLQGANLSGANLQKATLEMVFLQGADLSGADLQGAVFEWVEMQSANLATVKNADTATFDEIEWDEKTKFPPNIIFTDRGGKEYKTDENGKPVPILFCRHL